MSNKHSQVRKPVKKTDQGQNVSKNGGCIQLIQLTTSCIFIKGQRRCCSGVLNSVVQFARTYIKYEPGNSARLEMLNKNRWRKVKYKRSSSR